MSLQSQIQQIINDRKIRAEKIQVEIDNIDKLSSNLEDVKKRVLDLSQYLDNSAEYIQKIQTKVEELATAKMQALHLRDRFYKKSVNIGVSGFTHAGKSTLLQAISGLTDEEIPKANVEDDLYLHATTAICSQIFNSQKEYAEIVFKSEEEFVKSVNVYTEKLLISKISTKSEIANIVIPEREDGEPEKNTAIVRLTEIKEAYDYYSDKIDYRTKVLTLTRNEFNTLSNYVSCQASCKEKRFYPAVKEVRIYCKFPSFKGADENTDICLVDLPGFGNFDDDVQTRGLREKVDHIIFIYKTDKAQAIDNDQYVKCQRAILNINDFKTNKLDFESFIINEDKTIDICNKLTQETIVSIKSRYGNYKTFNFSAYDETEKSREVLNEILGTLTTTLPNMDDELISAYMKNRDLSEIEKVVSDLVKYLNVATNSSTNGGEMYQMAEELRTNLSLGLKDLFKEYRDKADESDFESKVEEIRNAVEDGIKENLLLDSSKPWIEFNNKKQKVAGGWVAIEAPESHRIWTEIINQYEKLNIVFDADLNELKSKIVDIFKTETGSLISKYSDEGLEEILSVLEEMPDNCINKSFVSLKNLKQDFRLNIYPYIFKKQLELLLTPASDGGQVSIDYTDRDPLRIREQYENFANEANYQIYKAILEVEAQAYFYVGAIHTFEERIIRGGMDNLKDFIDFCEIFKTRLDKDKYGDKSDGAKIAELKKVLQVTKSFIEKF